MEQFPSFAEYVARIISEYKGVTENALQVNTDSQNTLYKSCDGILRVLEQEMQKETLSKEERQFIEDEMLKVAQMIYEKDSENKRFILKAITTAGVTIVSVVIIAASILGANHQARFQNTIETI